MVKRDAITVAIDREMCTRSLAEFVRQAWPAIEPSTPLKWAWPLDAICDHVQALFEDRLAHNNLIINVPPGSMKSTILSVCLPAWLWVTRPSMRGIFTSGNEGIALRDSMRCRDVIESDWYQETFRPGWRMAKDQNAKGHYKNSATGWRKALSAGARITGDRGDSIVVDDPNDAAEAFSKAAREKITTWWDNAASNRLNDLVTGKRIIIQQRLHEEDLTGHVLTKQPGAWEVLIIRQEYEKPRDGKDGQKPDPDLNPTSLGWTDPRTEEGALFFPERFPRKVVEEERLLKGSAGYAGQHQQRPTPAQGMIFKRGHVGTFNLQLPPAYKRVVISLDTAFKEDEENDFSVAQVWGEHATGYDILDRWAGRVGFPDLKAKAKTMADAWRPRGLTAVLIEDKASGQSLIQELKKDSSLPVVPIKVDRDKVSRANAVVPLWEAGRVRYPEGAAWADEWLEQLYGFPKLAHDDDVDSTTQALNYLNLGGGSTGFLDWLRQEHEERERKKAEQAEQAAAG